MPTIPTDCTPPFSNVRIQSIASSSPISRFHQRTSYPNVGYSFVHWLDCVPLQPGQSFKFTVLETLDRIKEEFQFLQAQYHSLKLECEKLASEKTEMQRHYIMVSPGRGPQSNPVQRVSG
ncbi:transducin-like enhancer protein 2 [Tachysurus ichikawai]